MCPEQSSCAWTTPPSPPHPYVARRACWPRPSTRKPRPRARRKMQGEGSNQVPDHSHSARPHPFIECLRTLLSLVPFKYFDFYSNLSPCSSRTPKYRKTVMIPTPRTPTPFKNALAAQEKIHGPVKMEVSVAMLHLLRNTNIHTLQLADTPIH